jgi:hypothetical protein
MLSEILRGVGMTLTDFILKSWDDPGEIFLVSEVKSWKAIGRVRQE